jgi:hypothetical protein
MITIKAEREHYCLLTDDGRWTVAERRAGKYYPLGDCAHSGFALNDPEAVTLFTERCYPEQVARRVLEDVATDWRELCEHIR